MKSSCQINGAFGCQSLAEIQYETRKVQRSAIEKTTSNQYLMNSVLNSRSPELWRIWRRENGIRGFGPVSQCRGFPANPAVIGDFRHRSASGEFSAEDDWRWIRTAANLSRPTTAHKYRARTAWTSQIGPIRRPQEIFNYDVSVPYGFLRSFFRTGERTRGNRR